MPYCTDPILPSTTTIWHGFCNFPDGCLVHSLPANTKCKDKSARWIVKEYMPISLSIRHFWGGDVGGGYWKGAKAPPFRMGWYLGYTTMWCMLFMIDITECLLPWLHLNINNSINVNSSEYTILLIIIYKWILDPVLCGANVHFSM